MTSLAGKQVLVIRPQRGDDPLPGMLQQRGARVLQFPVIRIDTISESQAIKNRILDFDSVDIAIFVSARAARLALDWLDQYWPMLPQGVRYLAVGEHTAEVLIQYGCGAVYPDLQSSEGLLAMPELEDVTDRRITIFRGEGGRELLGDELRERGAQVNYCELYRRMPQQFEVSQAREWLPEADAMLAHSGELLHAVGDIRTLGASQVSLVVPSQRVADIAARLGYRHIAVAKNAAAEAMCCALEEVLADCSSD